MAAQNVPFAFSFQFGKRHLPDLVQTEEVIDSSKNKETGFGGCFFFKFELNVTSQREK